MTAGWWLCRGDGTRLRLPDAALLIGRSPDCQVILGDPRVSAYHALLTLGPDGPRLIALGRVPPLVDGAPAARSQALADGAVLEFPGEQLRLCGAAAEPGPGVAWGIERVPGFALRPAARQFSIGGGRDDIVLPGWPRAALACHLVPGAIVAVPRVAVQVRGRRVPPADTLSLGHGDRVEWGGEGFTVLGLSSNAPSETFVPLGLPYATRLCLAALSNGGHLQIEFPDGMAHLRLSALRCRLLGALFGVDRAVPAGTPIADDELIARIWPGQGERTHLHLNQVIHRLREALLGAGIDPLRLILRDRSGPLTWLRVGPETLIDVVAA